MLGSDTKEQTQLKKICSRMNIKTRCNALKDRILSIRGMQAVCPKPAQVAHAYPLFSSDREKSHDKLRDETSFIT